MAAEKRRISLLVVIILVILLAGLGFILTKSKNGPPIQPNPESRQENPKEPAAACIEDGGVVNVGAASAQCCGTDSGVKPSVQLVEGSCVASQEDAVGTCVAGWNKMCGNGICDKDNGENQCSCPRDCNADGTDRCAQEGETLGIGPIANFNAGACCKGLVEIKAQSPNGGNCDNASDTTNSTQVCAKCGDGVCGIGENKCSCPQDCDGSDKCVGEGGYLGEASGVFKCCQGLTELDAAKNANLGSPDACIGSYATCAKCGDGICGAGENNCNCAQDCPKPVAETQTICNPVPKLFSAPLQVTVKPEQKADCEKSGGKMACSDDSNCKCSCP